MTEHGMIFKQSFRKLIQAKCDETIFLNKFKSENFNL